MSKRRALVPARKPPEHTRTIDNPFGLWFPESEDEVHPPYSAPDLTDEPFAPSLPGYQRVETLFVDMSGYGHRGEAALTHEEFVDYIKESLRDGRHYGYGIIDVGQFQCHIGVYKALPKSRKRRAGGRFTPRDLAKADKRVRDLRAVAAPGRASHGEADNARRLLPHAEKRLQEVKAEVHSDTGPELTEQELRGVLKRRLLKAVKKAHYDENDQTCDICVAVTEGLPIYAAKALMDATECDEVEDIYDKLTPTKEELEAERAIFDKIPHTECDGCDAYTYEMNENRPDTCYECREPISWDDDDTASEGAEVEDVEDEGIEDTIRRWITPDDQLPFDFSKRK